MAELPYAPRPGQEALVDAIQEAQARHTHLVAEAPTGLGKTVCALAATLDTARRDGRKLVYLTRTNSQQAVVVKEHAALRDAGRDVGLLIPFMGRRHSCPLLRDDPRFREGTPEELGRLCSDAKKKALAEHTSGEVQKGACPYYRKLLEDGTGPIEALLESHRGGGTTLAEAVAEAGSCAYEGLKLLMPEARGVVVPYVFLVDDPLRATLLGWLGCSPDQVHVVVDEAHNLPEAARAHHSPRLGLATLERALKEAEEVQDPLLAGRVLATSFLTLLHKTVRELADEHAGEREDGWMPADALDEALMLGVGAAGPVLERVAAELEDWGSAIRERRRTDGKLPRSYLGAVGAFLRFWRGCRELPYVHLAVREPRPAVEAYLLEPASRLAWLREAASSTHLSGTLEPVRLHRRLCGLPADSTELVLPSPFPPEHLRLYGVLGLHRKHAAITEDPSIVARQQEACRSLLRRWTGRIALWFPSHRVLADYLEEGLLHGIDAEVFAEEPDLPTPALQDLVHRLGRSTAPRAILCGVLGGRLTEGIDYPGDLLEKAVVLGVPYPRPSARLQALVDHHERTDGEGWRLAVHEPVGRVLRQAVGRLIRGPDDEGTVVVLDERVVRFRTRLERLKLVDDADAATDEPYVLLDGFRAADALDHG